VKQKERTEAIVVTVADRRVVQRGAVLAAGEVGRAADGERPGVELVDHVRLVEHDREDIAIADEMVIA